MPTSRHTLSLALVVLCLQLRASSAQVDAQHPAAYWQFGVTALTSLDDHFTRMHDMQRRLQEIGQQHLVHLDHEGAHTFKLQETIHANQHLAHVKVWAHNPCRNSALQISDLNVRVDDKVMTITGVAVGNHFARTYTLPDHAVPENITATYTKDNILCITCPISPPTSSSPRNIGISIEADPQTPSKTADSQPPSVHASPLAAQTQESRQQQQQRGQHQKRREQQQHRGAQQQEQEKRQEKQQQPKTTHPPSLPTKVERDTRKDYVRPQPRPCTGNYLQTQSITPIPVKAIMISPFAVGMC